MKYLKLFIIGMVLLFSGCINNGNRMSHSQMTYVDSDMGYFIKFPEEVTESGSWKNATTKKSGVFFGSNLISTDDSPNRYRDLSISIHENAEQSCMSAMGASKTVLINNHALAGTWGKVDFWENPPSGNQDSAIEPPLCLTPAPGTRNYFPCTDPDNFYESNAVPCSQQMRRYEIENGMYSGYGFCAEKDDKRVVVCIEQITDNPKLAEEIFSTFRWTE
jgi:hypothetical protein